MLGEIAVRIEQATTASSSRSEGLSRLTRGNQGLIRDVIRALNDPVTICCRRRLSPEEEQLLGDELCHRLEAKAGVGTEDATVLADMLSLGECVRLQDRLKSVRQEMRSLCADLTRLKQITEDAHRLQQRLDELPVHTEHGTEIAQLRDEKARADQMIGRLRSELQQAEERLENAQKERTRLDDEYRRFQEVVDTAQREERYRSLLQSTRRAIEKFVSLLREVQAQELEKLVKEMFGKLATTAERVDSVSIDTETFKITLQTRDGRVIERSNLSAGEKEVFAVSLLWALAKSSHLSLPIIIDTPLSRLDSTHRVNIVQRYLPNAGDQVIVLSTDTEVDQEYYQMLEPYVYGSARLVLDRSEDVTRVEPGYFWR